MAKNLDNQLAFLTHQLRYLPRDKGLAEEASARFERWLEAPDRQDVLPDDLKTSMFKSLGCGERIGGWLHIGRMR